MGDRRSELIIFNAQRGAWPPCRGGNVTGLGFRSVCDPVPPALGCEEVASKLLLVRVVRLTFGRRERRVVFADGPALPNYDAVTAGLTTQWNSGPVEGAVNRIKMLKRQMFGRVGFALLRKRVPLA